MELSWWYKTVGAPPASPRRFSIIFVRFAEITCYQRPRRYFVDSESIAETTVCYSAALRKYTPTGTRPDQAPPSPR